MATSQNVKIGVQVDGSGAVSGLNAVTRSAKGLGGALGHAAKASQGLKNIGGALQGIGGKISGVGGQLTAGLTLPLIAIGKSALDASVNLNKGMANVAALVPGNTAKIQAMKSEVQDMAIKFGKSTDDLTAGLYQTVSAFGLTNDSIKILGINSKAATAGLASTQDAINLTSAATKAYGDTSAKAVQQVADFALKTVSLGQTTFAELASSVGKVTPIAKAANVSMAEIFATVASFSGVTGSTSEVMTQMRAALTSIIKPTGDMNKIFQSLGVTTGEALIKQKGFAGALQLIAQQAEKSKINVASAFGSVEALTLVLALSGSGAKDYADKLKQLQNSAGETDKAFAEQTQGINKAGFRMQQTAALAQVLQQKLGDVLAPALAQVTSAALIFVPTLQSMVNGFINLPVPMQNTIIVIAGIVALLGPLLVVVGSVITAIGTVVSAVGSIGGMLTSLVGIIGTVATAIKLAGAASLAFVASPAGLVIGAIALIAGGAYLIYKNWNILGPMFNSVGVQISTTFQGLINGVGGFFDWMSSEITKAFNGATSAISSFWNTVGPPLIAFFTDVGKTLLLLVQNPILGTIRIFGLLLNALLTIVEVGGPIFIKGLEMIGRALYALWFQIIPQIVGKGIQLLIQGLESVGKFIHNLWTNVLPKILLGGIQLLINVMVWFINYHFTFWTKTFPNIMTTGFQMGLKFLEWYGKSIYKFWTQFVPNLIKFLFEAGKKLFIAFGEGMKSQVQYALQPIIDFTNRVKAYLPQSDAKLGGLSQLTKSGKALFTTIAQNVDVNPLLNVVDKGASEVRKRLNIDGNLQVPASANTSQDNSVVINYNPVLNVAANVNDRDFRKILEENSRQIIDIIDKESKRINRGKW